MVTYEVIFQEELLKECMCDPNKYAETVMDNSGQISFEKLVELSSPPYRNKKAIRRLVKEHLSHITLKESLVC